MEPIKTSVRPVPPQAVKPVPVVAPRPVSLSVEQRPPTEQVVAPPPLQPADDYSINNNFKNWLVKVKSFLADHHPVFKLFPYITDPPAKEPTPGALLWLSGFKYPVFIALKRTDDESLEVPDKVRTVRQDPKAAAKQLLADSVAAKQFPTAPFIEETQPPVESEV